ncbi:MAG: hypothetical protein IKR31_04630, partial [Prevotella sp.]|nr:hypothetical protein [Prevotella sp.]
PQQVNPYRAYLSAQSTEARILIDFGETTGIKDAVKSEELRIKSYYDLQGRKIVNSKWSNGQMPKGLYIVNGKKHIVK